MATPLQRYKNLMPAVEITNTKSTIVVRCIEYYETVDTRTYWLREAEKDLENKPPHDNLQAVKVLVEDQEDLLAKIDDHRPVIEEEIVAGKILMKEEYAPQFLSEAVHDLEERWNNTEKKAKDKHVDLQVCLVHIFMTDSENDMYRVPTAPGKPGK